MKDKTKRILIAILIFIVAVYLLRHLWDLVVILLALLVAYFAYENWDEVKRLSKKTFK